MDGTILWRIDKLKASMRRAGESALPDANEFNEAEAPSMAAWLVGEAMAEVSEARRMLKIDRERRDEWMVWKALATAVAWLGGEESLHAQRIYGANDIFYDFVKTIRRCLDMASNRVDKAIKLAELAAKEVDAASAPEPQSAAVSKLREALAAMATAIAKAKADEMDLKEARREVIAFLGGKLAEEKA